MIKVSPQHVEFQISNSDREVLERYNLSNYGIELYPNCVVRVFNDENLYWSIQVLIELGIFLSDDVYKKLVKVIVTEENNIQ